MTRINGNFNSVTAWNGVGLSSDTPPATGYVEVPFDIGAFLWELGYCVCRIIDNRNSGPLVEHGQRDRVCLTFWVPACIDDLIAVDAGPSGMVLWALNTFSFEELDALHRLAGRDYAQTIHERYREARPTLFNDRHDVLAKMLDDAKTLGEPPPPQPVSSFLGNWKKPTM